MSGDIGSRTFDELYAIVGANRGDDLRVAGEDWARAADMLDRQADTLAAGLPTLERAWDSAAGRAHTDGARALVDRMRATADLARYNHAQMLAAADATDEAIRQLELARESAERDSVARDVADALNETYANAAARLTEPLPDIGHPNSPRGAARSGPRVSFSGTGVPAAGDVSDGPAPGDDTYRYTSGVDIDPDLPDAVGWLPTPASRTHGPPRGGQGECFPAAPPPAVAPVLSGPSSGPPAASSGVTPAAPRPTGASRRAVDETFIDARGHQVRIRWRGDGAVEPHP